MQDLAAAWHETMAAAAAGGDLGVGFPTGTFGNNSPELVTDQQPDHPGLRWTHTPNADPTHPIHITIYETRTTEQASEMYAHVTRMSELDGWKEWPQRFPDHGNDYEGVEHCGIKTTGAFGRALWTQEVATNGGAKWYVVDLAGGTGGVNAFDVGEEEGRTYADGVYLVICTMAKHNK